MGSMPLTLQGSRGSWLSPLPLLEAPLVAVGPADIPLRGRGSASGVGTTLRARAGRSEHNHLTSQHLNSRLANSQGKV